MDKTLPLARSEGDGERASSTSYKLLAKGGAGIFSRASSGRNKRKETAAITKKAKGRKAKATSSKGKAGAEVKDLDGSTTKRGRPNLYDKDRKPNRGAKGEDKVPRRSASIVGVGL